MSPACISIVSPFTISFVEIFKSFPSLITFAKVLLYSSCKASLLELFLYSDNVEKPVASAIARMILTISIASFPPEIAGNITPSTASTILSRSAKHKTFIHISSNAPINIDNNDSGCFFASSFVPNSALLLAACSPDKPFLRLSFFIISIMIRKFPLFFIFTQYFIKASRNYLLSILSKINFF